MKSALDLALSFLAGFITSRDLQEAGASEKAAAAGLTGMVNLPSGYNAEVEREVARTALDALCQDLINDPNLAQKPDGTTFCNFAVQRAAMLYKCRDLDGLTANTIAYTLCGLPGWRQDTGERAAKHAMRGGLAIAAKAYPAHGHVAVIAPQECQHSGSLGKLVPIVANVGRAPNRFCKVSEAFPPSEGEPDYYLFWEVA